MGVSLLSVYFLVVLTKTCYWIGSGGGGIVNGNFGLADLNVEGMKSIVEYVETTVV